MKRTCICTRFLKNRSQASIIVYLSHEKQNKITTEA